MKIEDAIITIFAISILILLTISISNTEKSFNALTGKVTSTVFVVESRPSPCNFFVEQGWNTISFHCITGETNRSDVVGNITNIISIFEYEEGSFDSWKSYNPSIESKYIQDLTTLSRRKGYYLRMNNTEQIYINGSLRVPTRIDLIKGWNLAGYPTNKTKDSEESFTSINDSITEVRTFNNTLGIYLNYIPGVGGAIHQTTPNQAYWINATKEVTWVVD